MIYTGKFYRAELYQDNTYPYTNVKTIYDAHKDDYPGKKLVVTNGHWCEGAKPCPMYKVNGEWLASDSPWNCLGLTWSGNDKPRWVWSNGAVSDNFVCTIPALVNGVRQSVENQTAGVKRLCNRTWWGWDTHGDCVVEVTQTGYTLDGIIDRMQSLGIVDGIVLDGSGSSQWCDGETWYTGSDGRTVYEFLLLWFEANNDTVKTNKEADVNNSPLVKYTAISPNKASRTHAIDTITIHHVVGQCSVEQLGALFAPASRKASSNYGVGADGRVGMYVEEKDRAWTSSSTANDDRAVTIEVADDAKYPYKVGDAAFKSLIELCADICLRNGIPKLLWQNDKSLIGQVDKQNMTVHRWFASTACPGDWLMEHMGEIAEEVNKKLDAGDKVDKPTTKTVYRVMEVTASKQLAAFSAEVYAERYRARMIEAGKNVFVTKAEI